jgi:hypothetical protein
MEILTGFLLGDGWLEKGGCGARLGISLVIKFKDVAELYQRLLYELGYVNEADLPIKPLTCKNPNAQDYYQIRTFNFHSLLIFHNAWYLNRNKVLLIYIEMYFTPKVLAICAMGDGSGMKDGGFKLASHCFNLEDNLRLCALI